MTRFTDLSQKQRGYALAMNQAQGWRGREKVSGWWGVAAFVLWAVIWFFLGGLVLP